MQHTDPVPYDPSTSLFNVHCYARGLERDLERLYDELGWEFGSDLIGDSGVAEDTVRLASRLRALKILIRLAEEESRKKNQQP